MSSSALKIAWALAVASSAGAVGAWVYANDPVRAADLILYRETSEEARRLDAENKRLASQRPKDEEIDALRKTNAEMLRIRTETLQARREIALLQRSTNAPTTGAPELAELSAENQRLKSEALAIVNRAAAVAPAAEPAVAVSGVQGATTRVDSGRVALDMIRKLREQGADDATIRAAVGGLRRYQQETGTAPATADDLSKYVPADILEKLKGETFEIVQKTSEGTTYISTNSSGGVIIRKETNKP